MIRRTLFGPPGTGKTTALINEARGALDSGLESTQIGFVSFSRRALKEAKERMGEVTESELPHFRTIHSTAFQMLGLSRTDVVQPEHLVEFGKAIGLPITGRWTEQPIWEGVSGDRVLGLQQLARARQTSLEHEWRKAQVPDLPWPLVKRTAALYDKYKATHALWDFADMIEQAEGTLDVEVLYIDEAQDTSALAWAFLRRVAKHVPAITFAGDDDQAVYEWGGADPGQLTRFRADVTVLPHSWRLPRTVKVIADRVAGRIKHRFPKQFSDRGEEGEVTWIRDVEQLNLHDSKTWLLLARSNYQLKELRQLARQQGVVYSLADGTWSWTLPGVQAALGYERMRKGHSIPRSQLRHVVAFWHKRIPMPLGQEFMRGDVFPNAPRSRTWMETLTNMPLRDREYVRALRRSGESLTAPGRVRISTVHGAKGAQADSVVLLTDISERVATGARVDPDAERRVQYVGVTRAFRQLILVQPKSQTFWHF